MSDSTGERLAELISVLPPAPRVGRGRRILDGLRARLSELER